MKLYQIHGFGSIGNNGTASWLKETFPEIELIHPDHPVNPAHCLSFAMRQLLEHGFITEGGCLYGTSLGGFYALLAHLITGLPAVLVNPSLRPWENLKQRVGRQVNYYTGKPFDWIDDYNSALRCFGETVNTFPIIPDRLLVVAGEQDKVVRPEYAVSFFSSTGVRPLIIAGQGHRIDKGLLPRATIYSFLRNSNNCQKHRQI